MPTVAASPTIDTEALADKLVTKARAKLIIGHPFYAVLVLHTKFRMTRACKTAAASCDEIIANPDFISKWKDDEVLGVMAHETLHIALGHVWRRGKRDAICVDPATGESVTLWNIAADMVVNQMLKESGFKLPGQHCQCPHEYIGWSVERIYDELLKNAKNDGRLCQYKWCDEHIEGSTADEGEGDGDGKDGKGKGKGGKNQNGKDKAQQGKELEEKLNPKPLSESQKAELSKKWGQAVDVAVQNAKVKGKGDVPAGIDRYLQDFKDPKLRWDEVLPHLLTTIIPFDYSGATYDRRFIPDDIYLPDMDEKRTTAAVGIDSSGSIGEEEAKEFLAEIMSLLSNRSISGLRLLVCDADVHQDQEVTAIEDIPNKLMGGGGTDFRPVFNRLQDSPPNLLIFLTDGMGNYPDEPPPYPVLWVLSTNEVEEGGSYYPPFGYVVYLNP